MSLAPVSFHFIPILYFWYRVPLYQHKITKTLWCSPVAIKTEGFIATNSTIVLLLIDDIPLMGQLSHSILITFHLFYSITTISSRFVNSNFRSYIQNHSVFRLTDQIHLTNIPISFYAFPFSLVRIKQLGSTVNQNKFPHPLFKI